jgi:hypothetical protein
VQWAAALATPSSQLSLPQAIVISGKVQLAVVVPSHWPPQRVLSLAQARRVPTGAPVTGEHVPGFDDTLQAAH